MTVKTIEEDSDGQLYFQLDEKDIKELGWDVEDTLVWKEESFGYRVSKKEKPSGGPSDYYDFPYSQWVTANDQMEYLAEHRWGKFGIHLKDIFKGLCRWGEKDGTTVEYDSKKIIYYGLRVLMMVIGVKKTREYIQTLLDDKQFGG